MSSYTIEKPKFGGPQIEVSRVPTRFAKKHSEQNADNTLKMKATTVSGQAVVVSVSKGRRRWELSNKRLSENLELTVRPLTGTPSPYSFLPPDQLGSRTSTDVKNRWASVLKEIAEQGIIAVTNRKEAQVVMMGLERYESIMRIVERDRLKQERAKRKILDELNAKFEQQYAMLQTPAHTKNVQRLVESRGVFTAPTKLGPTR